MAYTPVTLTATGGETSVAIPWNYLRQDHVVVTKNDSVILANPSDYTLSGGFCNLSTSLLAGESIKIERDTPTEDDFVEVSPSAGLPSTTLNNGDAQALYAIEEKYHLLTERMDGLVALGANESLLWDSNDVTGWNVATNSLVNFGPYNAASGVPDLDNYSELVLKFWNVRFTDNSALYAYFLDDLGNAESAVMDQLTFYSSDNGSTKTIDTIQVGGLNYLTLTQIVIGPDYADAENFVSGEVVLDNRSPFFRSHSKAWNRRSGSSLGQMYVYTQTDAQINQGPSSASTRFSGLVMESSPGNLDLTGARAILYGRY